MTAIPPAIEDAMKRSTSPQPSIAWPRASWVTRFPSFQEALSELPDLLDRDAVRAAAQNVRSSPRDAQWGFLVAMIWGFGRTGYGPWRVQQMFASVDDPATELHWVALTLDAEGVSAAYSLLGKEVRMTKLGPAFGTKFLYFCPPPRKGHRPLILDKLVAAWLRGNTDLRLNPVPWSLKTYERYLTAMHGWAAELGVTGDAVEQAIFRSQADAQGGQWASAEG